MIHEACVRRWALPTVAPIPNKNAAGSPAGFRPSPNSGAATIIRDGSTRRKEICTAECPLLLLQDQTLSGSRADQHGPGVLQGSIGVLASLGLPDASLGGGVWPPAY